MNLRALCEESGFSEVFLLPNAPYENWARHHKDGAFHSNADYLTDDPQRTYPWANTCMICVWPYRPYDDPRVVAAYYPASNAAYHAMSQIIKKLNTEGIRAERANTPFRTQLLLAGIGTCMDNRLWYYPPYGTYVHLEGVMLDLPEPVAYSDPSGSDPVCDHCGQCENACRGRALHKGSFDWKKCIRAYMENQSMPEPFMQSLDAFSGCMACQDVCPKNPKFFIPVPENVRKAMDPVRIVRGETKDALELIGKNYKKQMIRQAIILCANKNRTEALPDLLRLKETTGDLYSRELEYAIFLLAKKQECDTMTISH